MSERTKAYFLKSMETRVRVAQPVDPEQSRVDELGKELGDALGLPEGERAGMADFARKVIEGGPTLPRVVQSENPLKGENNGK